MEILLVGYSFVVFFILAFLVDRLPFMVIINKILALNKLSLQTITSTEIEDSKKQEMLMANSMNIFKESSKLVGLILIVAACGFLFTLLFGLIPHKSYTDLLDYVKTLGGILLSVVAFVSYFLIKKLYVKFRL